MCCCFFVSDTSNDRSGSSLNSEEKYEKRKDYLDNGIDGFNKDLKDFLNSVGKGEVYDKISSATSVTSLATFTLLAIAALVML